MKTTAEWQNRLQETMKYKNQNNVIEGYCFITSPIIKSHNNIYTKCCSFISLLASFTKFFHFSLYKLWNRRKASILSNRPEIVLPAFGAIPERLYCQET